MGSRHMRLVSTFFFDSLPISSYCFAYGALDRLAIEIDDHQYRTTRHDAEDGRLVCGRGRWGWETIWVI